MHNFEKLWYLKRKQNFKNTNKLLKNYYDVHFCEESESDKK